MCSEIAIAESSPIGPYATNRRVDVPIVVVRVAANEEPDQVFIRILPWTIEDGRAAIPRASNGMIISIRHMDLTSHRRASLSIMRRVSRQASRGTSVCSWRASDLRKTFILWGGRGSPAAETRSVRPPRPRRLGFTRCPIASLSSSSSRSF